MKIIPFVNAAVISVVMLLAAGCAVPTMNLKHEASIGTTYTTKGNVQVQKFKDSRVANEKVLHQTAANKLTPQIWSGNTSPEMMRFFQKTIEAEARNTRLFSIGDGEFTLSGNVSSLKVDRTCTIFRYLLGIFDFPKLEATVVYEWTLNRHGKVVLTKKISHTKSSKYWAMTEMSWTQVSNKARRVLDEAITESIKMSFDEIEREVMQAL